MLDKTEKLLNQKNPPNCVKFNYHQQGGKNESRKNVVAAYASFT